MLYKKGHVCLSDYFNHLKDIRDQILKNLLKKKKKIFFFLNNFLPHWKIIIVKWVWHVFVGNLTLYKKGLVCLIDFSNRLEDNRIRIPMRMNFKSFLITSLNSST